MGKKIRSWTDEQLATAVASATSYRGVGRAIGLQNGSTGHIKRQIEKAGLDTSHFRLHARFDASDVTLKELVEKHATATEVLTALGVPISTYHFKALKQRLKLLGVDTSHFRYQRRKNRRPTRWTDDALREAVATSHNFAETIRKLGLIPAGGNYDHVQGRVRELALDTSHFRAATSYLSGGGRPTPLEDVLVSDIAVTSHTLKLRLIKAGLKRAACELCGWAERRPIDGVIPIELDHINGNKRDNRLENLRVLCPNCHALQPTHRGLNKKKQTSRASESIPWWLVAPVGFEPTLKGF